MQGWEFAVVAGVLLLLFGGSRLPKLARSLGEARTELEKVRKESSADDAPAAEAIAAAPAAAATLEVVSVVTADPAPAAVEAAIVDTPAPSPLRPPLPPPGA